MPSQLWSMLKPPQPHWTSKHHSYQPMRPYLLVLLLLREEGSRRSLRLRAQYGPGPRNGPRPKGRETRSGKQSPDNWWRAHAAPRTPRDRQSHQRGRSRSYSAQHQRHQPSTQPQPCNGAERRGSKQPLHELRRSQPQDQPQESLGSTLHDRELPQSQPWSRTRTNSHQIDKRPRTRRNTPVRTAQHRHCQSNQLPAGFPHGKNEEARAGEVPNHHTRLHRENRGAD